MDFGLSFEISVPRNGDPNAAHKVFHDAVELAQLADQLGFKYVWAVEHHFLEELSESSSPELFLTAVAMKTERIRIGHGVVLCVPKINPPVRIAERAATLDILSHGRLEFGTGRSTTWNELGGFGVDPDSTKQSWDECVRTIPKMWMQDRFRYEGVTFSVPERTILPKPYQQPHPPMWVAVSSPGTEVDAAERGLGCLLLSSGGPDVQRPRIETYRRVIADCTPVGAFVNNHVSLGSFMYCHEDSDYAKRTGFRIVDEFNRVSAQNLAVKEVYASQAYAIRQGAQFNIPTGDRASGPKSGICIGSPDEIIATVKEWEAVGVDSIKFQTNIVDTVPQEEVLASLELFAKRVMPAFQPTPAAVSAGSVH